MALPVGAACFLAIFPYKGYGDSFWYDNAATKYVQLSVREQTYDHEHSYTLAYYAGGALQCIPDFRQWDIGATCHQMNTSHQIVDQSLAFRSEIQWPDGYVAFEQFSGGSKVYTQNTWYPPGTSANSRDLTLPLGHYTTRVGVSVSGAVHPEPSSIPGFREGAGGLLFEMFVVPKSSGEQTSIRASQ